MDIYHLKTFVAVAREGSITRTAELLHLSQPAVSAHIKAIEDALGLTLFERAPRGMSLTVDGQRLLAKAEQSIAAHQALVDEAARMKGQLSGTLVIGAGSNASNEPLGRLLRSLSSSAPDVAVTLKNGTSAEMLAGLRNRSLDAGFYNDVVSPAADLSAIEVATFKVNVVAAPGLVSSASSLDWNALAELPWIYPTASACCGGTAARLFKEHRLQPKRIINVDREASTRSLVAGGLGVGLLHADTAQAAKRRREIVVLYECANDVSVFFAALASRANDPLISAASAVFRK